MAAPPLGPWPVAALPNVRRRVDPLLSPYIEAGDDGLVWLRSPWGCQIPLVDPELASEDARRRNRLIHQHFAGGEVTRALVHVERPYRFAWLAHEADLRNLPVQQLAEGVLFSWASLHLLHPVAVEGFRLLGRTGFVADVGTSEPCITTERPTSLSGELTVYRGASAPAHIGATWTRDPDIARAYARQYALSGAGRPTLFTGVVRADDARAYMRRDESVVVRPHRVRVTSTECVA